MVIGASRSVLQAFDAGPTAVVAGGIPTGAAMLAAVLAAIFALGGVFVCVSLARTVRTVRRRRAEEADARAARRESAVRILWSASGDFLSAGWGRHDLERLRLLALNIAPGQVLGPRLAERLRSSVSAVLAGVLDRLGDVVVTAREVEIEPQAVGRLEGAIRILIAELEDVTCRAGAPVEFRPMAVAHAASQAVDACGALREALRPQMVSDLGAIVASVAHGRHAGRLASGELVVDLAALESGAGRVAARPLDLSRAIDELLYRVFTRGQVGGPVHVTCRSDRASVVLSVSWSLRDRSRLDPRPFSDSLRVLTFYDARLDLEEAGTDGFVLFRAVLPAASRATAASRALPTADVS